MIGQTISHYRILNKLGAGGMGEVYLARDVHLDREVAIKFPSSSSLDEHDRARFLREARLASTFQHPNIATVFDFGETPDSKPFLVIELVRGRPLHHLIKSKELTLSRSVNICLDVAKALAEAHRHGILHRDIKPSNIVLTDRGEVKVLDFGLAKQLKLKDMDLSGASTFSDDASLTAQGVILGTPSYMSPEQVRDAELDGRSDLYSLGVTLYECATGVPPFRGGGVADICEQVLHSDPRKPTELNPAVTPALERVVLKAMKKDPGARYESVAQFGDALRMAADSLSSLEARKLDEGVRPADGETESIAAASGLPEVKNGLLSRVPRVLHRPFAIGIALIAVVTIIAIVFALRQWGTSPGPESRNLFTRGVEALQNGSFVTASSLLTEAVKTHDNWPMAHARLAEAWVDLDNVDLASREVTAAHARAQSSKLTTEDDLYLKAITSTVDLKYSDAVKTMEEIHKLHPTSFVAVFDSARSLERASRTDDAIARYEQALRMEQRSPSVHLRLGVLYGRKRNFDLANVHFDRAREIYQGQQSSEGVTEVSLQRAGMNIRSEKFDLSRPDLEGALKQSRSAVPNAFQEVRSLLQLSVVDSQTGKLDRAHELALEAFGAANRSGLDYVTTAGNVVLGDVFFRKNQIAKGEEYTARALQLAERYRVPRWIATASFNLGSMRIYQNRSKEGLELIRKAKEYYDKAGNTTNSQLALTQIARTQRDTGDYAGAQKTIEAQLTSTEKKDGVSTAHLFYDLARLKLIVEDFAEARKYYDQASKLYREGSNPSDLSLSLGGLAASDSFLGSSQAAQRAMAEALKVAHEPDLRFNLLVQESRIALVNRSFATAVYKTSELLKGTDESDKSTRIPAKVMLAAGLLGLGRFRESEKEAREAIEIARGLEGKRLLAMGQLALAEALVDPVRPKSDAVEALNVALAAQREFGRGGQRESECRALIAAASAGSRTGDSAASHGYAQQANVLIGALLAGKAYENYGGRPDVQNLRKRLVLLIGK